MKEHVETYDGQTFPQKESTVGLPSCEKPVFSGPM